MAKIHPTAIVDRRAELADDVEIGPYSTIGPHVKMGAGTRVQEHCVIQGYTTIGSRNEFFPFAIVGTPPDDLKYRGGPTETHIGDNNVIREFVLIKAGTETGGNVTVIGSNNLLMGNAHVAHDCIIGNNCVIANFAALAGHVQIHDNAVLGGMTGFHQFVRIGEGAMVGGGSLVGMDVAPFCIASGNRARLYGLNSVGLERRQTPENEVKAIKKAYRTLFRTGLPLTEAIEQAQADAPQSVWVNKLLTFLRASTRGVTR